MSQQFAIYKSYLPNAKQLAPVFAVSLLLIALLFVNGQINAQDTNGSVTDQAISGIEKQINESSNSAEDKENTKDQKTEGSPQSTTDKATEGAATVETESDEKKTEEPQPAESSKESEATKPTKEKQPETAPVTNAEQIPTTGPVENTIAVVAIVATGYLLRDYLRSRALLVQAVFSK